MCFVTLWDSGTRRGGEVTASDAALEEETTRKQANLRDKARKKKHTRIESKETKETKQGRMRNGGQNLERPGLEPRRRLRRRVRRRKRRRRRNT